MGFLTSLISLLLPIAALGSFTARTGEIPSPGTSHWLSSPDGKIDQILVVFDADILSSPAPRMEDFEVVGYQISAISSPSGPAVTLTVVNSDVQDSGNKPVVRFFPGRLIYQVGGGVVGLGSPVLTATLVSDGCPPVWDVFNGAAMFSPALDGTYQPHNSAATPGSFYMAFSEPVDLTAATLQMSYAAGNCPCPLAISPVPVDGRPLSGTTHVVASALCDPGQDIFNDLELDKPSVTNFVAAVFDKASPPQAMISRDPISLQDWTFFTAYTGQFGGGEAFDDATMTTLIGTIPLCNRTVQTGFPFFCNGNVPARPRVSAVSMDLDGNGLVDTIQVRTQQWRLDMTQFTHGIGDNASAIVYKREVRPKVDTLVFSNRSLWSLPGYTITGMTQERGRVLLTVAEVANSNTTGITSLLNYTGVLTTWTGNVLDANGITVDDRACPIITAVKAWGNANNVTVFFSEPITGANATTFTSILGATFLATAFTGGTATSNTFVGTLATPVNYQNFGAIPLKISGLSSIVQTAPQPCGLRRNYVNLSPFDTTPPVITQVLTRDSNNNGRIDGFSVIFSEPVVDATVVIGQFSVAGYTNLTYVVSNANDNVVDFTVNELPGINTTATPVFTATASTLVDLSNNPLGGQTITSTDGVGPYPLSARTGNDYPASNPYTNKVVITFSENVLGGAKTDFVISSPGMTIANYSVVGAVATLYISLTPTPIAPDVTPTVTFTQATAKDNNNNLVPNFVIVTVDRVAPVCGIFTNPPMTEDTNGNGYIDRITIPCLETIINVGTGSFQVANYTVVNATSGDLTTCPSGYPYCLMISVQEQPSFDTGATPGVTYTGSPVVTDVSLNPLDSTTFAPLVPADKIPPVLTKITTKDTDADGKIDVFRMQFSEPMTAGNFAKWTIPGYTVLSIGPASGSTFLDLRANATGAIYDGGATPLVSYIGGGAASDAVFNSLPVIMNFPSVDGVFPIVLNAFTNGNCKMSSVQVSLNENINLTSVNIASFDIQGYTITGVTPGGVLPFGFSLQVTPLTIPDAPTPFITYHNPLTIADNGANSMANFSFATKDRLAPCMIQCSGHVGGSYVQVTFTEPVFTGVSSNLGLANFQLNGTNSSYLNSSTFFNSSIYTLGLNTPFTDTDINFNVGDTFAYVQPFLIHDASNNNATASCYVFNDDKTPPTLVSAKTVNTGNADAQIDRIMLTFDDAVSDSTFNPADWSVSTYGIANISTGLTPNDNVVFLNLNIKSSPDTGATPTITYTKPAVGGVTDRNRNKLNSTTMIAIDNAPPLLALFQGTILRGNNILIATFSEPVTGINGFPTLNTSNFNYNGSANGGATAIATFLDADASDGIVVMRMNAMILTDFNNDNVVATVWDHANLTSVTTSVFLTKGDVVPPVVMSARTGDVNNDGQIDHLTVAFNESMLDTSFQVSAFSLAAPYTLSNLQVNDTVIDIDVSGSVQLDGNATPALTFIQGTATDLNGNLLKNFTQPAADGVRPFLLDCSSTLPFLRTIDCLFSEVVTGTKNDFVVGGPLLGATITTPTTPSNGQLITIQLNRVLVLNDFKTGGTVDLVAGNSLIDQGSNFGRQHQVSLRNTDVFPPNITDAATRDTDCNGFIDAIELIFSEGVIDTSVIASNFAIGGGFVFTGVVKTGLAMDDNSVMLVVNEGSTPNTDAGGFPLTYSPGSLTDLSENAAAGFTINVRDGAGVALVNVTGTVDTLDVYLTFSAIFSANNNVSEFQLWNFSSPTVSIAQMLDKDGTDGNVSFRLTTPLLPRDFELPAKINPLVLDLLGNPACGVVGLSNPDKTKPIVTSISTNDENSDGHLDSFIFNCSKPIDELSLKATDFTVTNYTVTSIVGFTPPSTMFKLYVAQKNDTIDASVKPQVSYTQGSLTDRYGNKLATFANMQSTDGAGPAIISAVGVGSTLVLTFSKPIYNSTKGTTFNLTDVQYIANGSSSPNVLRAIIDQDGSDSTLGFTMLHAITTAEYASDMVGGSARIFDVNGNPMNPAGRTKLTKGSVTTSDSGAGLTDTEVILIGAVGGGGLFLLIVAAILVVVLKKKGVTCCKKKKEVAFDQNQIANEFDFGSSGGATEMTQSSRGVQRLEA